MAPIIVSGAVSTYQWLLFLHITGAFLLVGGAVVAIVLDIAAQGRERPSEIALLLGLIRIPVVGIVIGSILLLVFGLWLVDESGYSYGEAWIVGAIVLLVAGNVVGAIGGRRDDATRQLAEELAAKDDAPSVALKQRLRDPISLILSYFGGAAVIAALVLMVWKPGA
jgi:uncharacterized membrane protein